MSAVETIISHKVCELVSEAHKNVLGKKVPAKKIALIKKSVKGSLSLSKNYRSFGVTGDSLDYLFMGQRLTKDDFGRPCVYMHPAWANDNLIDKKFVQREIDSWQAFFKAPYDYLGVVLYPFQEKMISLLNRLEFRPDSFELTGLVSEGLKYTGAKKPDLPPSFHLDLMNYRHDIDEILKLERRCHKSNSTSRVPIELPSIEKNMRSYYFKASKDPHKVWLLRNKKEIVGLIAAMNFAGSNRASMISSIAVDPKWQGKKISHFLYHHALCDFKKNGHEFYTGFTTTDRVIRAGKKMGRKVSSMSLIRKA